MPLKLCSIFFRPTSFATIDSGIVQVFPVRFGHHHQPPHQTLIQKILLPKGPMTPDERRNRVEGAYLAGAATTSDERERGGERENRKRKTPAGKHGAARNNGAPWCAGARGSRTGTVMNKTNA